MKNFRAVPVSEENPKGKIPFTQAEEDAKTAKDANWKAGKPERDAKEEAKETRKSDMVAAKNQIKTNGPPDKTIDALVDRMTLLETALGLHMEEE